MTRVPSPRPGPDAAPDDAAPDDAAPDDAAPSADRRAAGLAVYVLLGTFFGIVLIKAEVVSWFRIQEMFRFQSFHMYGIIGSALAVSMLSVRLIRGLGLRTAGGEEIRIPRKEWGRSGTRYWAGGLLFGFGWALTGACPGPLFALIGAGVGVIAVALVSAVAGAWLYGALRPRLPH